jgi:hypothetical protein
MLLLNDVQKLSSTVTEEDLRRAGIARGRIIFDPPKVIELTKGLTINVEAEIVDLYSRVKKIYALVGKGVCSSCVTKHFQVI